MGGVKRLYQHGVHQAVVEKIAQGMEKQPAYKPEGWFPLKPVYRHVMENFPNVNKGPARQQDMLECQGIGVKHLRCLELTGDQQRKQRIEWNRAGDGFPPGASPDQQPQDGRKQRILYRGKELVNVQVLFLPEHQEGTVTL